MDIKIEQVEYHRNGVCGSGFWAVRFTDKDGSRKVGIVFRSVDENGNSVANPDILTSVLDVDMLAGDEGVRFGVNSYRGDLYHGLLNRAIDQHLFAQSASYSSGSPIDPRD